MVCRPLDGKARANVYLIGFMGAGKTTVGKALAAGLGLSFQDLDQVIEAQQGLDIATLFEEDGEPAFRKLEERYLKSLAAPVLVALGGGAFMTATVREYITASGISVYLHWPFSILWERVGRDPSRPLARHPRAMEDLYRQRLPVYEKARLVWRSEPPNQETPVEIVGDLIPRIRQARRS